LAGSNTSVSIVLGEELEEEDRVVDVGEGGVCTDGEAEVSPNGPVAVL
jgi:hypothetical protein